MAWPDLLGLLGEARPTRLAVHGAAFSQSDDRVWSGIGRRGCVLGAYAYEESSAPMNASS